MSRRVTVRWPLAAALAVAYVAVSAATVGGLFVLRGGVLAQETAPAAAEGWQRWKADSQRISREQGPVARRPVTSNEPPSLILLRDYFGNVVMAVQCMISGVFAFLVIVLWSRLRPAGGDAGRRRLQ